MRPMDFHDFLRSRRSTRRFTGDGVARAVIDRILSTARYAPSSHNRQPWRFAVSTEAPTKSSLANAMAALFRADLEADGLPPSEVDSQVEKSRARINAAPLIIVLCVDVSDIDVYPDPRRAEAERVMALQSTANAGYALLLAAHAEGLGGVWSCAPLFAPAAVKTALRLPSTWEPQALFLIGPSAEAPKQRPRRSVEELSIFV